MTISIGQQAPEFNLYSSEGKAVSLADFKGRKVVIHFFPLAFTGVCTTQLCTLRDTFGTYRHMDAEILAISVDSPFSLAKFKTEQNLPFTLLSDFNKEASRAYGALYDEFVMGMRGVSRRAAFVLDENQTIIYSEVLESAQDLPDFESIQQIIKAN
ncbi:MAG TPA: peroxiredoxin [Sphingobacteriaceae bacterium]